jgi:hypothetical protein
MYWLPARVRRHPLYGGNLPWASITTAYPSLGRVANSVSQLHLGLTKSPGAVSIVGERFLALPRIKQPVV